MSGNPEPNPSSKPQTRVCNAVPSPDDPRDHVVSAIYPAVHADSDPPPATLDLRPYLQEVRDQGSTSTCAAQTAACIKEYQEFRDTGLGSNYQAEFVYYHRENAPADGMYGRDVMSILKTLGIPPESWAFTEADASAPEVLATALEYQIAEYALVQTQSELKEALANDGPCYISFPVFNYGTRLWKAEPGETRVGGHAMTVVGYTNQGFILRNSWGDTWGDKGHCIYLYEDWGSHWEIWTSVDRKGSRPPFVQPPLRKRICAACAVL